MRLTGRNQHLKTDFSQIVNNESLLTMHKKNLNLFQYP
jgi:hypothetical protein